MQTMLLEECCEILDSMRIPITASNRQEGPYPYYGANGIQDYVAEYIFDDELVLLAEDGGNFGSKTRPIAYRVSGKCWVNNHAHVLKPKAGLDVDFLCFSLMFYNTDGLVNGATRQKLTQATMRKMQIPDLPLEEQKEIVNQLNTIVAIKDMRNRELQRLDELIKARFVEMFDLNNCEYKTLGDCTDFIDYRGHTPELSVEGTIRMLNAKSVGKGYFKYIDEYITEETYDSWMHRGFGYAGDILFVTEGHTFGNTCLIPEDMTKFALGQRVITIKGHDDIKNAVLCSYMQTDMFWKDINVYRTGGTAQGIRSKDLVKVSVPIPPIDKQIKFVEFVKQVDKSKVAVQKALDKTQLLFDSLMQKYFG